mgnify:CR=1 FL=1|jgi:hypothetical protein
MALIRDILQDAQRETDPIQRARLFRLLRDLAAALSAEQE